MTRLDSHQLGQRIRARRTSLGWSQVELAQQLGVSFQQVQKYETGQNCPRVFRLLALCDAFGLTLVDMLDGLAPAHLLSPCSDPLLRSIVSKYRRLNRGQKKRLLNTVTSLLDEVILLFLANVGRLYYF